MVTYLRDDACACVGMIGRRKALHTPQDWKPSKFACFKHHTKTSCTVDGVHKSSTPNFIINDASFRNRMVYNFIDLIQPNQMNI